MASKTPTGIATDFFPEAAKAKVLETLSSEDSRYQTIIMGRSEDAYPWLTVKQEQELLWNNMYFMDQCTAIAAVMTNKELVETKKAIEAHRGIYKPGRILTSEHAMDVFVNVDMVDTRYAIVINELNSRGVM